LGKETIRLIDDLAEMVTGKRDFFRPPACRYEPSH
jgi:hypothetical protein